MQEIREFKAALVRGDLLLGTWLNLASPNATEIAGAAGFDWCLIDGEHAPYDVSAIQAQLRALAPFDVEPVVRVPVGEDWVIKQVLDLGAGSLMVPMVDDADQARALVHAVRFAPRGVRGMGSSVVRASGYGRDSGYVHAANDAICLIVQAETRAALENLDEIAAVEGVDGVFIGPADLSADMGFPGRKDAPEVVRAIHDAARRIRAAGKGAGIIHGESADYPALAAAGFNFLGLGSDVAFLRTGLDNALARARAALE